MIVPNFLKAEVRAAKKIDKSTFRMQKEQKILNKSMDILKGWISGEKKRMAIMEKAIEVAQDRIESTQIFSDNLNKMVKVPLKTEKEEANG